MNKRLVALTIGVSMLSAVFSPLAQASTAEEENAVIRLLNAERGKAGLNALTQDKYLTDMSRHHSQDMKDHNYFGHVSPTEGDLSERAHNTVLAMGWALLGENLGIVTSPEQAIDLWMKSPTHKSNMLTRCYTRIGAGVVDAGTVMYVSVEMANYPADKKPSRIRLIRAKTTRR